MWFWCGAWLWCGAGQLLELELQLAEVLPQLPVRLLRAWRGRGMGEEVVGWESGCVSVEW